METCIAIAFLFVLSVVLWATQKRSDYQSQVKANRTHTKRRAAAKFGTAARRIRKEQGR